jgi:hypothetical protein
MALKTSITLSGKSRIEENGLSANVPFNVQDSIYIKVQQVNGDKTRVNADVVLTGDSINGKRFYSFTPDLDGPNFIKQAYNYLKTLPEFAGAIDC